MKQLYAILTKHCNLQCPHCTLHFTKEEKYNEELFLSKIQSFDGPITLFGGEPTLYPDRLIKVLSMKKKFSLSTNLLYLNDEILENIKTIPIATSWNLSRFNLMQYNRWLTNLKVLNDNGVNDVLVLITMMEDLIDYPLFKFLEVIKYWDISYKAISRIRFEYLIDPSKNKKFYEKCDDWLCKVHDRWNFNIINDIETSLKNDDYIHLCRDEYTLYPNGKLIRRCPQKEKIQFLEECLSCEYSNICTPCRLQNHCTFPKKLYKKIKEG